MEIKEETFIAASGLNLIWFWEEPSQSILRHRTQFLDIRGNAFSHLFQPLELLI